MMISKIIKEMNIIKKLNKDVQLFYLELVLKKNLLLQQYKIHVFTPINIQTGW